MTRAAQETTAERRAGHRLRRHATGLLALALGLFSFGALFLHADRVGYTRDESFYFSAAERYADWFRLLVRDPAEALGEPTIRRHYETNREHPVLVKNLMALSYLALAADTPRAPASWPPERTGAYARAMRLPAQLFSALAVVLTFLLGARVASRRVGLLAALAFLLAPRHFFHAQLACFDMPAVTVWLATVIAYRRAQTSLGWSVATGAAWGLAIATKHNSFFLPVVLGLHWLCTSLNDLSLSRQGLRLPRIPLAFLSMLILGPAIFVGHWPLLWHATWERIGWYFGFHLHHVHYWWEYFGNLLTEPPFPWSYPFAVCALTLPLPTLLLGALGFFQLTGRLLNRPLRALGRLLTRVSAHVHPHVGRPRAQPRGDPPSRGAMGSPPGEPAPGQAEPLSPSDAWLLWLNALLPFAVIAWPWVPIFGGVKHWLHAMPFVCILGALALERVLASAAVRFSRLRRAWIYPAVATLSLLPSIQGLWHIGGYGTCYYNELAGGVSGAASLGMQRQFWSSNLIGVLPYINEHLPRGARLYLHEVTGEAFFAYRRDGLLRPDFRLVWTPELADFTVYQYHREFVDTEYRVWNKVGQRTILHGLYIDQVPIVLVYDSRKPAHRSR